MYALRSWDVAASSVLHRFFDLVPHGDVHDCLSWALPCRAELGPLDYVLVVPAMLFGTYGMPVALLFYGTKTCMCMQHTSLSGNR